MPRIFVLSVGEWIEYGLWTVGHCGRAAGRCVAVAGDVLHRYLERAHTTAAQACARGGRDPGIDGRIGWERRGQEDELRGTACVCVCDASRFISLFSVA